MKTKIDKWQIRDLLAKLDRIDYPEFQREPTVWKLKKKQKLIDSILRGFDISLIYFFKNANNKFDCIDGRQRINAILSYLGSNGSDEEDNGFHLKIENEIYDDGGNFNSVDNKRYQSLDKKWKDRILDYCLNIVFIEEVETDEELNLLFLRLQIASVLNAGEKLHAMTGDMRDCVFIDISQHKFFESISIPQRRYAREQVAAQIVLNEFNRTLKGDFHRSRYIDLQDFFKQYTQMGSRENKIIEVIKKKLDIITKLHGNNLKLIKNRATAISVFLLLSELIDNKKEAEMKDFIVFFIVFTKTLEWQLPKGVKMNSMYHDLLNFQTNISQAAGEKTALQKRHDFLKKYFYHYKSKHEIIGDTEYYKKIGKKPRLA